MKIVNTSTEHSSIGTEWECNEIKISVSFDENELDAKLMKRFSNVVVNQRKYTDEDMRVWMKGLHTTWFGVDVEDPQKKYIWNLVDTFLSTCQFNYKQYIPTPTTHA